METASKKCKPGFASAALAIAAIALTSCASEPLITRRYDTAVCTSVEKGTKACTEIIPSAIVTVTSVEKDPPKSLRVTDLSDHAQAAYVMAMGDLRRSDTANDLRRNIAAVIRSPTVAPIVDNTPVQRTIVITVAKDGLNPADRFDNTRVTVKLSDDSSTGVRFKSWDKVETEYTTFDLGTIKSGQKTTVGAEAAIQAPDIIAEIPEVSLSGSRERSLEEQVTLKGRAEILTVSVMSQKAVVHRQGISGIDLTGQTFLGVELAPIAGSRMGYIFSADGFYDSNGKVANPAAVKIGVQRTKFIPNPSDIRADVTLTYVTRHVISGDTTLIEGDDQAQYIERNLPVQNVVLVPAMDLGIRRFGLVASPGNKFGPLFVRTSGWAEEPFCFGSYEEADNVRAYLQTTRATTLAKYTLGFMKTTARSFGSSKFESLKAADVKSLDVEACY
jgi:hypothetical protein